jgi:serine/threonine-protein kinase TNNI3K
LNKAKFSVYRFPDLFRSEIRYFEMIAGSRQKLDDHIPAPSQPFTVSNLMADYLGNPRGLKPGVVLGRGGSARVTIELDQETGKYMAVKSFWPDRFKRHIFVKEAEILVKLNHPCVLRIVRWCFPKGSSGAQIHTEFAAKGSLDDVLTRLKCQPHATFCDATRIGIILCDLVLGMRYVYSRGIIHRDLKPSNVLITEDWRARVGDFGSSRFADDDATLTGATGSVHYAAPELFEDTTTECLPQVDVWSFGLIVFEVLVGRPVFASSESPFQVIRRHRNGEMPAIPARCGEFMQKLIPRCWSKDPSLRPAFDEILREFRAVNFGIIPNAQASLISEAVSGVLAWESEARRRGAP